jgi:hypothetical protein
MQGKPESIGSGFFSPAAGKAGESGSLIVLQHLCL